MVGEQKLVLELELELEQEAQQVLVELACHLVEQEEEEVFLAEPGVSDPWIDACCLDETVCGSAYLPRCRLHSPPCHWPLGVEDCCFADETSWKRKASSADWTRALPPAWQLIQNKL